MSIKLERLRLPHLSLSAFRFVPSARWDNRGSCARADRCRSARARGSFWCVLSRCGVLSNHRRVQTGDREFALGVWCEKRKKKRCKNKNKKGPQCAPTRARYGHHVKCHIWSRANAFNSHARMFKQINYCYDDEIFINYYFLIIRCNGKSR